MHNSKSHISKTLVTQMNVCNFSLKKERKLVFKKFILSPLDTNSKAHFFFPPASCENAILCQYLGQHPDLAYVIHKAGKIIVFLPQLSCYLMFMTVAFKQECIPEKWQTNELFPFIILIQSSDFQRPWFASYNCLPLTILF